MLGILQFIQQILSTPAIFVGLIALLGLLFDGTVDKVDGALRNLLITFRFSAIFLVISGKRYIFAEKSNV